jgi:hypothetical protein
MSGPPIASAFDIASARAEARDEIELLVFFPIPVSDT